MRPEECFNYELPDARIAQRPVYPYDHAKLLVICRELGTLVDSQFSKFADFISENDLVIFNDTKVLAARLFGRTASGAEIEILRLERQDESSWWCMARPLKRFKAGSVINFTENISATVHERRGDMEVLLKFSSANQTGDIAAELERAGSMPIPPYIRDGHSDDADKKDYQSVFAKIEGSVAAPTASLHFTNSVIKSIRERGCSIAELTLHVGPASFLPLWRKDQGNEITPPGREWCRYSGELLEKIKLTKARGGRVIAVGTTVVRALESMAHQGPRREGELFTTELFINPGYQWKLVDSIVTNYHQPHTSHLLLVQSFMGTDLLARSYSHALKNEYRFLSYGDGMLIL